MNKGVDISVIQGTIDFVGLKASGVDFVICRCYVGNGGKDTMYDQNIANATAAGLLVAAYQFVYPLPTIPGQPLRDPVAQAKLHASAAGSVPVVCCDLEWPAQQDWAKWGCSAAQIATWVLTYLQAYEAETGIRPVIYTYPYFAEALKLPANFGTDYKLWIASYATSTPLVPAPWTDWVLWQNSGGSEKLPNGVPVDTDLAKDLSLWNVAPVTTAAPVAAHAPDPLPPVEVTPTPVISSPVSLTSPGGFWQAIGSFFSNLFK